MVKGWRGSRRKELGQNFTLGVAEPYSHEMYSHKFAIVFISSCVQHGIYMILNTSKSGSCFHCIHFGLCECLNPFCKMSVHVHNPHVLYACSMFLVNWDKEVMRRHDGY